MDLSTCAKASVDNARGIEGIYWRLSVWFSVHFSVISVSPWFVFFFAHLATFVVKIKFNVISGLQPFPYPSPLGCRNQIPHPPFPARGKFPGRETETP